MLRPWRHIMPALCWLAVLCAMPLPSFAIDDGIDVKTTYGLSPGDVGLTWTGGAAPYTVFRGTDARLLFVPTNQIGNTAGTIWNDTPPPGSISYYSVAGAGCAPSVEVCDGRDNDCDGVSDEGGADLSCSAPHTTSRCISSVCEIIACDAGWASCDSDANNGCETMLGGHSNAPPGEFLGSYDADSLTGTFCSTDPGCQILPFTRSGITGQYFNISAVEASNCCAYVGMRFELLVPPGVDYDLHITGTACYAFPGFSSTGGAGQTETISVWCDDDCGGASNSFTANVEVRYFGGSSCQPWTLRAYRRAC